MTGELMSLPVSLEKWLERIENKQVSLDDGIRDGLASIRSQIEALEKSLPDRFLTRREWDVVLEAGKLNRESSDKLLKATNERQAAQAAELDRRIGEIATEFKLQATQVDSRLTRQESRGWWIAGAFVTAMTSGIVTLVFHFLGGPH